MKAFIEVVSLNDNIITTSTTGGCATDGCTTDMGGTCTMHE